jgi:chlorite dismutase
VTERRYVHALALGLDPAWRRLDRDERCRSAEQLAAAANASSEVSTFTYSMVGLKTGVDLLLWSLSPSLEALEEKTAGTLRAGMGSWMAVRHSFVGLISAQGTRSDRGLAPG